MTRDRKKVCLTCCPPNVVNAYTHHFFIESYLNVNGAHPLLLQLMKRGQSTQRMRDETGVYSAEKSLNIGRGRKGDNTGRGEKEGEKQKERERRR